MSRARISLIASALVLLVMAALALTARCLSLTSVSCSFSILWSEQPELDVPYAGTRPEVVAAMLDLARVGPGDHVVDLGTGDGRILIAAARDRGAGGEGVDLDPVLIGRAQRSARGAGVAARVNFRVEDLFETPLGSADVVTMFLLPDVNLRLRPRILAQMRPGSRLVSHAFDMGDWRPDRELRVGGVHVYLWIVPVRAAGRWRFTHAGGRTAELRLIQRFQRLEGEIVGAGRRFAQGELRGERIRLSADLGGGERVYEGRVQDDRIESLDPGAWQAVRIHTSDGERPNSSSE